MTLLIRSDLHKSGLKILLKVKKAIIHKALFLPVFEPFFILFGEINPFIVGFAPEKKDSFLEKTKNNCTIIFFCYTNF